MRRSISVDTTNKGCVRLIILRELFDKSGIDLRFKNYEEVKGLKLDNDLGLDSLDKAELSMTLEDNFSINILDEEIESIDSLNDLMELVYEKILV